jgi:hypothetical protein
MKLVCTHNIDQAPEIERGRMTYCRIAGSWHWFILVESGTYNETNSFCPDDKIRVAFSYVPKRTSEYITDKYNERQEFQFIKSPEDSNISTLAGYNLFSFTKSYVIDTWKLTDEYVVVKSKPVSMWKYNSYSKLFSLYNVISIFPYCGITDCIGYSNYHYQV